MVIAVYGTVCLAACGGPGPPLHAVSRIGDTTTVTNRSSVWTGPRSLRPVLTIGQTEGDTNYLFTGIRAFAVDQDGGTYLADLGGSVRRYTAAGKFTFNLARRGSGPGEVRGVRSIAVLADGRIIVRDQENGRLNLYTPDGRSSGHWALPSMAGYGAQSVHGDSLGNIYISLSPVLQEREQRSEWPRPLFARLSANGVVLDTIWGPAGYQDECPARSSAHFRSGTIEDIRWRYMPKVTWAITSGGALVIGCPARRQFDLLHGSGEVVRAVSSWPPVRASRDERDALMQLIAFNLSNPGRPWEWTGPDLPRTRPPFLRLYSAEDGRVWVLRTPPAVKRPMGAGAPAGLPAHYWEEVRGGYLDVFDRNGQYLGAVTVPQAAVLDGNAASADPVFRGDTAWIVTQNAEGSEGLTRFEVVP